MLEGMAITLIALATISGYVGSIAGHARKMRIKSPEDCEKVAEALRKSAVFNNLVDQGYSVEEIIEKLCLRDARGEEFEKITGVPWPL